MRRISWFGKPDSLGHGRSRRLHPPHRSRFHTCWYTVRMFRSPPPPVLAAAGSVTCRSSTSEADQTPTARHRSQQPTRNAHLRAPGSRLKRFPRVRLSWSSLRLPRVLTACTLRCCWRALLHQTAISEATTTRATKSVFNEYRSKFRAASFSVPTARRMSRQHQAKSPWLRRKENNQRQSGTRTRLSPTSS